MSTSGPRPPAPLRARSLRARVTILAVSVLAVTLAAVVGICATLFATASHRAADGVLADRITYARQLARTVAAPEVFVRRVEGHSVRAELVLADGTVYGAERSADGIVAQRTISLPGTKDWARGARLTLAVDGRLLTGVESNLLWGMTITALTAVVLVALLLFFGMRYALAPLDAMTSLARSITHGNRGQRLAPDRRDTELGRTAAAFDEMLDSLEGAEARERHAQQSVRRFVADAAHELRTPITGVQAIAETLMQTTARLSTEDRERLLVTLVGETHRAGRLVDDMVDMARIDAGLSVDPAPVDLADAAREQAERVSVLHPLLELSVHGTAPAALADPGRVRQILANLLDNACHATPDNGWVRVDVTSTPGWVHLTVADSGSGVPDADRDRIFERMVRLDDARARDSGGSGLGLAVARGLARSHGGELTLLPGEAPGATFRLSLPMAPHS